METIKATLASLLAEMEALPENREETALAVVSPRPRLPKKTQNKSSEIVEPNGNQIKLLGQSGSTVGLIAADIHDVEEIR